MMARQKASGFVPLAFSYVEKEGIKGEGIIVYGNKVDPRQNIFYTIRASIGNQTAVPDRRIRRWWNWDKGK